MNRTLLYLLSLVVGMSYGLVTPTYAQTGWRVGIVGGEDFTGARSLPSPFSNSLADGGSGFLLGVRSDFDFALGFSLLSEIEFTQRSFKDDITFPSGSSNSGQSAQSWSEKLQCMNIPILLKFTPIQGAIQPYAYAGPDVSIVLSANAIQDSLGTSQSRDETTLFNSININIDAGLGVQMQIAGTFWAFLEGRYTFGLTNAYKSAEAASFGDLSARDVKWLAGVMVAL